MRDLRRERENKKNGQDMPGGERAVKTDEREGCGTRGGRGRVHEGRKRYTTSCVMSEKKTHEGKQCSSSGSESQTVCVFAPQFSLINVSWQCCKPS